MRVTLNSVRAHRSAMSRHVLRPRLAIRPKTSLLFLALFLPVSLSPSPGFAVEWNVDGSLPESGDGTSWETAFKCIQDGINAATHGDTVIVAEGTYVENIHFGGKNIILTSTDPLNPSVVNNTVIDGDQKGYVVVTFEGTETDACRLQGFTIRSGLHGIRLDGWERRSQARILHNTIEKNLGNGLIGGMGLIRANTIRENLDSGIWDCDGVIEMNVIRDNGTAFEGGGLSHCNGSILNNLITDNSARRGGGLAYCQATIIGNTISLNSASEEGGGLYRCDRVVSKNVISSNSVSARRTQGEVGMDVDMWGIRRGGFGWPSERLSSCRGGVPRDGSWGGR
jgi:hypothetical protein